MPANPTKFLALASLLAAPPAFAAGGAGGEAPALPGSRLEVAMTLYAGGITMGRMDIDTTYRGTEYHAVSHMQTSGVVNAFWQAQIQATSSGRVAGKDFVPTLYDSFDTGRSGKRQQVSLSFEGGTPKLYADPVYATTGYEVKPEDIKNTLDPLSAVTFILSGIAGNVCGFTAPVFDGRRRYDVEMAKIKDLDIRMDNGLYQGKAVQCDVRYRQLAGFRPNVLKANESFPLIHAWIVRVPSSVAGRDYNVPVRVWADTKYGTLATLATSLKVDGQSPAGVKDVH
ncbi:MAG: DUF3108 domain-containing protein [Alphaproteobacteria bacterium]|nr:DUF3108 domain-containing protein [Alphaproteobacteria bacterium]